MATELLSFWNNLKNSYKQEIISSKTILLEEGEVAKNIYFIEKGCLRLYFLNDGKDITFQFFFEKSMVASFDSLCCGQPSQFFLESLEPTTIRVVKKEDFYNCINEIPQARLYYEDMLIKRFSNYQTLFLSRIKNTPQQRYEELLREHPYILQRVPQHYIASYLGITPVSLSRIRNRRT